MVHGAEPAQMLPLPAMAANVPNVIPIENGDTHPNDQIANGGETQSPIKEIKDRPEMYLLTDLTDLSHEDDGMLVLQIECAENREKILSRKIELKRRRAQNESKASSANGFNLTREFSIEIEIERARSEEAQRKIQMLEQEKHQIVLDSNQHIEHEK